MMEPLYSIVIPCYKSSKSIGKVVEITAEQLLSMQITRFEFILVNDCSPDQNETINTLRKLAEDHDYVKVVNLAKNAGQHNATMVGLSYASGDFIISMDDDLQTHPSQIPTLLNEMKEKDYDVIYGFYPKKKHGFIRNLLSKMNYASVRFLIGKPKGLETSSFWIIRKYVRDYVTQYQNAYPFLQGLFLRTTSNVGCIPIKHYERGFGDSNYNIKRLFKLWSNILGFSIKPLRIAMYFGVGVSCLSLLLIVIIIISKLMNPNMQAGWSSTMVVICFFSGVLLFFIGLIGEYVGRIYLAINSEPPCVIRETFNLEDHK